MKLKLHSTSSINSLNITKINNCLKSNCLVIITAEWCGHCSVFMPEKKKLLEILREHDIAIIDINDIALNELKSREYKIWKQIVPDDHQVYFPMIITIKNNGKTGRIAKKTYNGPRKCREIREYIQKIT